MLLPIVLALVALEAPAAAQPPKDPVGDKLRSEIALAQRDLIIAKTNYDAAMNFYQAKRAEGEKACADMKKPFDNQTLKCAEPPAPLATPPVAVPPPTKPAVAVPPPTKPIETPAKK